MENKHIYENLKFSGQAAVALLKQKTLQKVFAFLHLMLCKQWKQAENLSNESQ